MFNLQEINQMEKEMCNYLEWELTAANQMLSRCISQHVINLSSGNTGPSLVLVVHGKKYTIITIIT